VCRNKSHFCYRHSSLGDFLSKAVYHPYASSYRLLWFEICAVAGLEGVSYIPVKKLYFGLTQIGCYYVRKRKRENFSSTQHILYYLYSTSLGASRFSGQKA
jgi:hypothetical protein